MNGNRVHMPPEFDPLANIHEKIGNLQGHQQALGQQFMTLDKAHRLLASQVHRLAGKIARDEPQSFLRQFLETCKLMWPFLALTLAVTRMLVLMYGKESLAANIEWLLGFMERLKIE